MSFRSLPNEYALVIAGFSGTVFTMTYLAGEVMKARKKFGVEYPTMYSEDPAKVGFNLVQRGHQNALETLSHPIGGLKHPRIVTGLLLTWCIGRIGYAAGYSVDAKKRYSKFGFLHWVGLYGSFFTSLSVAYSLYFE